MEEEQKHLTEGTEEQFEKEQYIDPLSTLDKKAKEWADKADEKLDIYGDKIIRRAAEAAEIVQEKGGLWGYLSSKLGEKAGRAAGKGAEATGRAAVIGAVGTAKKVGSTIKRASDVDRLPPGTNNFQKTLFGLATVVSKIARSGYDVGRWIYRDIAGEELFPVLDTTRKLLEDYARSGSKYGQKKTIEEYTMVFKRKTLDSEGDGLAALVQYSATATEDNTELVLGYQTRNPDASFKEELKVIKKDAARVLNELLEVDMKVKENMDGVEFFGEVEGLAGYEFEAQRKLAADKEEVFISYTSDQDEAVSFSYKVVDVSDKQ